MGPAQHQFSGSGFGADALFVSALQCSEAPSASQIRLAIDATLRTFGYAGCAERVAQEFGDHPETAAARMRWARAAARTSFGEMVPEPRWTADFILSAA
jgi:hypothetical protein